MIAVADVVVVVAVADSVVARLGSCELLLGSLSGDDEANRNDRAIKRDWAEKN